MKTMMLTFDECVAENHAACRGDVEFEKQDWPAEPMSMVAPVHVLCTCPCHHPLSMKEFDLKEQYGN